MKFRFQVPLFLDGGLTGKRAPLKNASEFLARRELESVVKGAETRAAHPFPTALLARWCSVSPTAAGAFGFPSRLDRRRRRAGRIRASRRRGGGTPGNPFPARNPTAVPRIAPSRTAAASPPRGVSPRRRQAARAGIALAARRRHLASVRDVVAACRTLSHRATLIFFPAIFATRVEPSGRTASRIERLERRRADARVSDGVAVSYRRSRRLDAARAFGSARRSDRSALGFFYSPDASLCQG